MEVKLDCLGRKVDKLLQGQEKLLRDPGEPRDQGEATISDFVEASSRGSGQCECKLLCQDLATMFSAIASTYEQQNQRLENLERLVLGIQSALGLLVETLAGAPGGAKDGTLLPQVSTAPKKAEPLSALLGKGKPGEKPSGLVAAGKGEDGNKKEGNSRPSDKESKLQPNTKGVKTFHFPSIPGSLSLPGGGKATGSGQAAVQAQIKLPEKKEAHGLIKAKPQTPAQAENLAAGRPQASPPGDKSLPKSNQAADTGRQAQAAVASSALNVASKTGESKSQDTKSKATGKVEFTKAVKDGKEDQPVSKQEAVKSKSRKNTGEFNPSKIGSPPDNQGQQAAGAAEFMNAGTADNVQNAVFVKVMENQLLEPPLTDGPALRHVQSCPVSLQRDENENEKMLGDSRVGGKNKTTVAAKTLSSANKQELPPQDSKCPTPSSRDSRRDSETSRRARPAATAASTENKSVAPSLIDIRVSPAESNGNTTSQAPESQTCFKMIDDSPPQPAPFAHRFVALRPALPSTFFSINTKEVLGGGRFGQVHRCTEKTSGLKLAAKIIKVRNPKEKEVVRNEVQVMNQLSHANVIQLYDAFEVKNEVVLVMEYVDGGELFERIIDDNYHLTEVDAMVFVKQICEGIHYMHQMYVLHLDLKPENILCVNRTGHQVKIIDFGLARRYKPREKLRVSFGTPEFLAPEIVNFDFVSFPTDMWALGVISYMLLSGLSPFLGDDDSHTLSNVLAVNWYFDEEAFEHVSEEARDFISNLLIKEKSGRHSAAQCLKHPWLNNIGEKAMHSNICLKSQILLRKYMARRLWKKNYIAVAAANRFKKISSSGSLTTLGI
ncbi:myosin light chain kinase 2, skeletal/cardiac muscle-like [Acipenser oxyrinchus oxyrinchus]|uniref:Myosin light chain kinase 2, skeletal/cardiac muscle-like n=1 Tax=Acipenser oxyrinchus oxyrinchus TaxID=40147 RepID=A0AAD8CT30_ACIOX|nr:myosin light chain kinase 2, skeletal/cardiac muscle-like [Acipenser oxyrinchus oxyrinchus]